MTKSKSAIVNRCIAHLASGGSKGAPGMRRLPLAQNLFIFMQFLGEIREKLVE